MENHQRQAKRIGEEAILGSTEDEEEEEDRISELPGPILDHVISFLPQNDAFRTCILSKLWRHLGPTGPKIEFDEDSFPATKGEFLSVVNNTLKRYDDQNLPILEFVLGISFSWLGPQTVSLLEEWTPNVVKKMGVLSFNLKAPKFSLPSVVFQSEFLTELILEECKLDQINNNNVKLHIMLKLLSLHKVYIDDETLEKIMLSCPLIQHLVLRSCRRLRNVEVNKAPSLETISIEGGFRTLCHLHNNNNNNNSNFFPRLKSLKLRTVHLTTELLNNLSSDNCPCLEELQIHFCQGFTEFELSNCSIKRLIVALPENPIRAAIDAANMLLFEYSSGYVPTFSFSTASRECKSRIVMSRCSSNADDLSTWSLKLHEFLKSLRQSQISLNISGFLCSNNEDSYDGGGCEPAVVEHLCLRELCSSSKIRVLLNSLFRICRPRYIGLSRRRTNVSEIAESIWNILVNRGEVKFFWQQDLEESSIQVLQENANEWRPVQVCEFSNDEEIRFMLKWRELSYS